MLRVRSVAVFAVAAIASSSCGGSSDSSAPSVEPHDDGVLADAELDAVVDSLVGDSLSPLDSTTTTDAPLGVDVASEADTSAVGDTSLGAYPAGPYGNKEGSVIANLQWVGYVNDAADSLADTKPLGPYSMDAARRSGRRYALLHVAEFF